MTCDDEAAVTRPVSTPALVSAAWAVQAVYQVWHAEPINKINGRPAKTVLSPATTPGLSPNQFRIREQKSQTKKTYSYLVFLQFES